MLFKMPQSYTKIVLQKYNIVIRCINNVFQLLIALDLFFKKKFKSLETELSSYKCVKKIHASSRNYKNIHYISML